MALAAALLTGIPSVATLAAGEGVQMGVAAGKREGTRAEILSLERGADGVVTLRFDIVNEGAEGAPMGGDDFGDPKHKIPDHNSVGGVYLLDAGSKTRFPVDRDSSGKCVCARDVAPIKPGTRGNVWAQFTGLPEDLTAVTVMIPGFEPVEGVSIFRAASGLD